ncbi:hypothetical protein [Nostoc sp. UHCC 0252]|uniref:hypothetical protein n=1 Tax=Nostoc sp. UHCC 0252 TaxID=3110241 RepID=UPI002B20AAFD|nr:hypothetical protein [Nostoc sp. UHCC 0252]MEA5601769.1 hypothetical protein [Nostoc sp. UHCC 0252]
MMPSLPEASLSEMLTPTAGFSMRRYANAYALWRFFRRSLFLTNHRGAENTEDEESDRTLGVFDIAFFFRPKSQRSDRLLQIFYTCTI